MGWLDGNELDSLESVPPDEEEALLAFFDTHPLRPGHVELLGVDRYGADLKAATCEAASYSKQWQKIPNSCMRH